MTSRLRYAIRRVRAGWARRWDKRPPLETDILAAYLGRTEPPPDPRLTGPADPPAEPPEED